tara:strand:- start:1810 stop:2172 length:363 start_codon:yes stop_codon:yes gene_type:complete
MDGLIIFSDENAHPLAWLLHRRFRHVWCALRDEERGVWVSFNGHQGIPIVQVEAAADFDLASHYEEQGYTVVRVKRGTKPSYSPLVLNNCVGYVKVVMAVKCWSVTPYRLFRHLTKEIAG